MLTSYLVSWFNGIAFSLYKTGVHLYMFCASILVFIVLWFDAQNHSLMRFLDCLLLRFILLHMELRLLLLVMWFIDVQQKGGLSNRQKEHKKFMPIAAKRGKIARSKQEKKIKQARSSKQFRGKKAWKWFSRQNLVGAYIEGGRHLLCNFDQLLFFQVTFSILRNYAVKGLFVSSNLRHCIFFFPLVYWYFW